MEKNLFAKFIEKYSDDNSVFNLYLCQFYDTEANDMNRLVCGHPLHLDLHCLQSSLSQYGVARVIFFIYLKLCRRNFYRLLFCALGIRYMSLMTSGGSDVSKPKCRYIHK